MKKSSYYLASFILSLFFVGALFFAPVSTEAAGLVTCNGPDCTTCDVFATANNVINFLVQLISILATFALVVVGFQMVTSQGNAASWEKAKSTFGNIIIGFILMLASWLIVDTIMKALVSDDYVDEFGPWNELTCS